jgi:hypothetical protein
MVIKQRILFINCVVCLCVCLSVEVSIMGFRTSIDRRTDGHDLSVYFKWRCPGLIPRFFFFPPFFGGFAVYGRTGLCIFQMVLPRVNTRGFFFRLFLVSCPGLIPGFYYYYYFSGINRQSYSSYSI